MSFIKLDRPMIVFDIESTGVNVRADRIIELAAIKVHPNGARVERHWLLNPGIPIPIESTAVHGITNEAVAGCPRFRDVADQIRVFFTKCDLAGYNHVRFDIPILSEEFVRVGMRFNTDGLRLFDAQRIFHKKEPRDLTAAVKKYCDGETFAEAHGATADAMATLRVLEGQFRAYPDLPQDPDELDAMLNERDPFNVDRAGRLRWVDGEVTLNFWKNQGKKVKDIARLDPNFLKWMLRSEFPRDTQDIIQDALNGKYPVPPVVTPTSKPVTL